MKILLIGATGYVGSKLLEETLDRGHEVTALVSDPENLPKHDSLNGVKGSATDRDELARHVSGHDLVINAFNPGLDPDGSGTQAIIDGVKDAGHTRFLTVGGAGTLEVAPGQRLVDQPEFPEEWRAGALRTAAFLDQLRNEQELDWVFVSPSALLAPGERTGEYRIGKDQLLHDAKGESRISLQDFAKAMLDEAEAPKHHKQRFTVGY